jgi:photosystem II stability/assembly factor-like uncharacterized protein
MNERLVPEIRRALTELADATPPTPDFDDVRARAHSRPRGERRRPRLFTGVVVAVSLAAAVAGLVLISARADHDTPTNPPTSVANETPTTLTPPTTTPVTTPATTAAPKTTTTVAPAIAAGFAPMSITWISLQRGWLLGSVDCQGGLRCPSLARTDDGGQTWDSASVPGGPAAFDPSKDPGAILRVRFADPANGWIFGTDLYATHDGGATWKKVDGLTNVSSLEVAKGRAWAEASWTEFPDAMVIYSSPAANDDWHQIGPMTVSTPISLRGDTGYVRGPDGGLFVLTATGFDVRTDPCASGRDIAAIAAVDDQTVAVVCGYDAAAGSESKEFAISHDGGHTFTSVGEAPRSGILVSVAAASPTTFVMAATSGASFLYRSTDAGVTWQTIMADGDQPQFNDLGFTSASRGVVVVTAPVPAVLVTTDAGATWNALDLHG